MSKTPIDDSIAYALASLVDDRGKGRQPSHYDLHSLIDRYGLNQFDPANKGATVGKAKRVKSVLIGSITYQREKAEGFGSGLIELVRGMGGFRSESPNYVGAEPITNLAAALKVKGVTLGKDGVISTISLTSLSGKALTSALLNYVERAQHGVEDAALLVGTSKDLLEAVSGHVLQELRGSYNNNTNFPTLLGQAFTTLEMSTPESSKVAGEHPRKDMERGFFEVACSINRLRNKHGTGHGRPWLPDVTATEARASVEVMGIIAGLMLDRLDEKKK
tara:strand:- start:126995 stop:127822 length:828 start_codon:yes stop_codon:yes gene_type:complete